MTSTSVERLRTLEDENAQLRQRLARYEGLFNQLPVPIVLYTPDGTAIDINERNQELIGVPREAVVGRHNIFADPQAQTMGYVPHFERAREGALSAMEPTAYNTAEAQLDGRLDDRTIWSETTYFPLRDAEGKVAFVGEVNLDVTSRMLAEQRTRAAEAEQLRLQEEVIAAQQVTLRELSTPLIPIARGVVAMPLVGAIDTQRAQFMMEALLEGIVQQQAEHAIIDITGVKVVDTDVADALLRVARAANLLGAQVILTGIGPEIAQTLVTLGADLSAIVTRSNLQSGIAYALGQS
jgi:rsbT co-antagonist protein RsbR